MTKLDAPRPVTTPSLLPETLKESQPLLERDGIIIMPADVDDDSYFSISLALRLGRKLFPEKPIELRCHGFGGDAGAGFALIDLIKEDGNVDGILLGFAASAHSLIWAACARRYVYPNAVIGVHQAHNYGQQQMFEQTYMMELQKIGWYNAHCARIYAEASNKSQEWWREKLKGELSVDVFDYEALTGDLGMAQGIHERHVPARLVPYYGSKPAG